MSNVAALQQALNQTRVIPDYIQISGGLDEITTPYQRKPGVTRRSSNFESVLKGGHRRVGGYERFNGKTKPSSAVYSILNITITGSFSAGDSILGDTSAATAVVLAVVTTESPNYLVVTKVSGTFQSGEVIKVGGAGQGTSSSLAVQNSASTALLHATYRNLAADKYRADIAAPTGSGKLLGVVEFNDIVYAFRNNAGGTATDIYKSSGSGWVNVPLGEEISFTVGSGSVDEGDTLTLGGVTAIIRRLVITSGTLGGGTAAGRLVISGRSGGAFAAGAATTTGGGTLTLSGASAALTLSPNGRYEFHIENFGGTVNARRIYGCDGVNKGFEFDGSDYCYTPIATGMATDAPTHVRVHKKHLFFSFSGGSVQHSGIGTPYIWSVVTGASEIAVGDNVTAFINETGSSDGGALSIFTRNGLRILYGSSTSNWNVVNYRSEIGAYAYTVQDVGYTMFLDDRGITDLQTSQDYGNFAHAAVSDQVRDTLNVLRTTAVSSCVCRDKSQYRLFFTDGSGYYVTMANRKVVGVMPVRFPDVARCTWSGERSDGSEAMYFGSDDGHVYQMDRGTSFDGDAIDAYFDLADNFQRSPRVEKHYLDCALEIQGTSYAAFTFGYRLGYGSVAIPQPNTQPVSAEFLSVLWDSFVWDSFIWDGSTLQPSVIDIDGSAENISIGISSSSDIYDSFTITAAMLNFTRRGRMRP